jgi:adenylate cyclase class 2
MQEIEVKAHVKNPDLLKACLSERGVTLGAPLFQQDTVYTEGDWESVKDKRDRNILRVRKQNDKTLLTLKRNGAVSLHSLEYETTIGSAEEMHEILLLMKYQPIVKVTKHRHKGEFNEWEICLDEVEGLGRFIEVESLLAESDDPEAVQEEMYAFLESLGVAREDRETRGYDTMVRLKEEGKL